MANLSGFCFFWGEGAAGGFGFGYRRCVGLGFGLAIGGVCV